MTKISPDPKHSQLVVLVVVIVVVFVVVNDLVLLVAVAIDSVQCQPDAGDLTRPLLRGGVITLRSRYWVPNMMMLFTRVVAEIRASRGVKFTNSWDALVAIFHWRKLAEFLTQKLSLSYATT